MSLKYVNTISKCYKSITTVNNNILSYDIPFTGIKHDKGEMSISNFSIVTNIDFIGTNNESEKSINPLESKRTLEFIIRLTKCEKGISYDLDSFSVNLNEMYKDNQVKLEHPSFLNYTRTTTIDKLELPGGTGKYIIKVLIKDSKDKDYTIQSITQLDIT